MIHRDLIDRERSDGCPIRIPLGGSIGILREFKHEEVGAAVLCFVLLTLGCDSSRVYF